MSSEYSEPPAHYSASVQTLWLRIAASCKEPTRVEVERFYDVAYARGFLKKYPFLRKLVTSFIGQSLTPWQHLISSSIKRLDLSTSCSNSRASDNSGDVSVVSRLSNALAHKGNGAYDNIDDEGVCILSDALVHNRILKTLNLAGNKIRAKGAAGLAKVIKQNTALEELNLNDNAIGTRGCKSLAEALKKNSTLRVLQLRSNNLVDSAVKYLSTALLSRASSVECLDLAENQLRNSGAIAISEVLRKDKLKLLDLTNNKIGDTGCVELARAIMFNESLTSFSLIPTKGSLSLAAKQELFDAVAVHPNLGSGKGASNSQLPEKSEEEEEVFWWNEEERVKFERIPEPGPTTAPWSCHRLGSGSSLEDLFKKMT